MVLVWDLRAVLGHIKCRIIFSYLVETLSSQFFYGLIAHNECVCNVVFCFKAAFDTTFFGI